MTPAEFRAILPEFSCTSSYPDTQIQFWIDFAGVMVNAERWDTLVDQGTAYLTAHHLAISKRDQAAAEGGGIPGAVNGVVTAKSVDKVSVSYDASTVTLADAGFWNMSSYGIRFVQLARMVGAGGVQM